MGMMVGWDSFYRYAVQLLNKATYRYLNCNETLNGLQI